MARTTTGRSIVAVVAMAAALTTAVSGSARATSTLDVGAIEETSPPRTFADVDGDRVSDEFEADLLGAEPTALVDVIIRTSADVTYPGATPLPSIGGFAATMRVSDVLGFAADPGTVRVDRDGVVALTDDGGRADHGVDRAEVEFGATGAGVGICVIDSGVDPNHEQLDNGKVAAFTDFINPPGAPLGPYDDHSPSGGGHGTHVASIAAGDGVGGPLAAQYRGVAPDATLYVAKAFEGTIPDDIPVVSPATTQESITIQAIEWCVNDTPADIVSMSFTKTGPSDGTDPLGAAVAAAIDAGVVAVAAAGNDGPNPGLVGSPGALERVITVGAVADWSLPLTAVNRSEGPYLPAFSSRGPTADGRTKPDVVAPGHSVLAARSNTVALYADKSGTSMATPFVAGAVALVLEQHPTLGHDDVKALIEQTAIDRGPAGKDDDWGSGMLDVYGLLAAADGSTSYEPTPFPTNSVLTGSTAATGSWTHDFVLAADDLDIPIAATMLIDGGPDVSGAFWDPDLQLTLTDPNGVQLDFSNCPLLPDANDCLGNTAKAGRQELVHALPTVAGTYRLDVSGPSGSFLIDLTHGPVAAATPTGVCTVTWTGAGDGTTWSMPTNWSSLTGPLLTDVACIPAGAAVSLAGPATVRAVVVEGALTVQPPGMLLLTDPAVPSEIMGELVIDAGATVDTAVALDVRGRLSGSGEVDGSVNNRGDVRPGDSVPGDLTITADYTQYAGGTLTVDVGTVADRLVVGGTTALDGTLVVVTSLVPTPGDDVEILDAVVRTGTFATLDGADAGPSVHWEIDAVSDAPDVHLVAVAGPPVDADGRVTICHKPGTKAEKTKQVPPSAVGGHRGHGDTLGAC